MTRSIGCQRRLDRTSRCRCPRGRFDTAVRWRQRWRRAQPSASGTTLVGTLGEDEHAAGLRDTLERRGVNTTHLIPRRTRHRHALILVDERTGDRTVLWERDARLSLDASDVPRDVVAGARLLHVDDLDAEAAIEAAGIARAAGIPVTSDIDRVTDRTRALIAAVTIPIFAEHVPTTLTGEADTERALRTLRGAHAGMLCVTLGARGSMLLEGNQLYRVPAPRVEAVDATGAGDVFRGAFIYALLRGDRPADDPPIRERGRGAQLHARRRARQRPHAERGRGVSAARDSANDRRCSAIALALAAARLVTGGTRIEVAGLRVSSTDPIRPFVAAAAPRRDLRVRLRARSGSLTTGGRYRGSRRRRARASCSRWQSA